MNPQLNPTEPHCIPPSGLPPCSPAGLPPSPLQLLPPALAESPPSTTSSLDLPGPLEPPLFIVTQLTGEQIEKVLTSLPPPSPSFNWDKEKIKNQWNTSEFWGLFQHSSLCAVVTLRELESEMEIILLFTNPQYLRNGMMLFLLRSVLQLKQKRTLLEVHEGNLSAINLYRKLGFTAIARRKNYYIDGGSAILFVKE